MYTASHAEVIAYLTQRMQDLGLGYNSPNSCARQASAEIYPMVETALQWFDTGGDGDPPSWVIAQVLGDVTVLSGACMLWKGAEVSEETEIYPGAEYTPYSSNSLPNQLERTLRKKISGWKKTEKTKPE